MELGSIFPRGLSRAEPQPACVLTAPVLCLVPGWMRWTGLTGTRTLASSMRTQGRTRRTSTMASRPVWGGSGEVRRTRLFRVLMSILHWFCKHYKQAHCDRDTDSNVKGLRRTETSSHWLSFFYTISLALLCGAQGEVRLASTTTQRQLLPPCLSISLSLACAQGWPFMHTSLCFRPLVLGGPTCGGVPQEPSLRGGGGGDGPARPFASGQPENYRHLEKRRHQGIKHTAPQPHRPLPLPQRASVRGSRLLGATLQICTEASFILSCCFKKNRPVGSTHGSWSVCFFFKKMFSISIVPFYTNDWQCTGILFCC